MKRLPSHPLHFKFEAPTKNRLKRRSPNHLVKALQQKHRIPSSVRNQPLVLLHNFEDWQAETATIILDIPGIQAKEHHTDEELRSLTLGSLRVPTHLAPGQELTQMGQQKRQQKMAEVEFSSSFPMADPPGSLWPQGSSQPTTELKPMLLLTAAQTLNQEERLPTNTVFLIECRSIPQSLQSPEGEQIFSNIRQELCDPPGDPFSLCSWRQ